MNLNSMAFVNFLKYYALISGMCTIVVGLKLNPSLKNGIAKVSSDIALKYFSHLNCILVVTENNLHDLILPEYTSNFNVLVSEDAEDVCYVPVLQRAVENAFEHACTGFIIRLSKPLCFLKVWKNVVKKSLHRHNPRILILATTRNKTPSLEILNSRETEFFMDVTFVDLDVLNPEVMFNIVTSAWNYERQTLEECKADECTEVIESLYPDKISDLKGIEMKVATFSYPPYAILQPLEGTEIRMALEYAQRHNCSLRIITDKGQWGQIFENGTGDGILGAVAEGRADMGLGALYLWFHEYQFLDFSVPYIRTGITCLAPRPKLVSSLLLPIRPFTLITWIIVMCVLTIASAALFLIKKLDIQLIDNKGSEHKRHRHWFTTKADTILRTFGFLVLQASSNRTVETASIGQLVNWLHVMFFLVATSYCSGLASILTVPSYQPPIDTVEDLVDSGWQWGATHDAWVFSLREATEPPMSTLVARFRALSKEQLHYNSLYNDFAFSIERLPAGHYAIGDYITEESMKHLRLMKKDIYYEHCTLVFQKGSPYLKSFNVLIHRLLASGILFFWEGEVARKFLRSSLQSAVKESTTVTHRRHPTAIHFSQCEGAFILLGGGLMVGIVTFLTELYIGFRHSNRKKEVKFRVARNARHFQ